MNKKISIIGAVVIMLAVALSGCNGNGEITRFEHYTEMHSVYKCIFDNYWSGQTFTVNESHYIVQVNLYISKVSMPNGNITVSIRETEEKYLGGGFFVPVGDDLVSNITLCNSLPDVAPEWVEFSFEDTELEAGTYAIVVGAPDANETAHPRWRLVQDVGNYTGGTAVSSSDYGGYWGLKYDDDFLFEEYGKII